MEKQICIWWFLIKYITLCAKETYIYEKLHSIIPGHQYGMDADARSGIGSAGFVGGRNDAFT